MRVLIINTGTAENQILRESLEWLRDLFGEKGAEAQLFDVQSESLRGCVACGKCYRSGRCIFDDEVNKVIAEMENYDGLIIGGEVLYGDLNDKSVHFLERLFHAGTGVLARKPGSAVLYSRRRLDGSAAGLLAPYFAQANMPVVAVQSGHVIYGDSGRQKVLSSIVSQMIWLMNCLEAGKNDDVDFADGAPERVLNFIR